MSVHITAKAASSVAFGNRRAASFLLSGGEEPRAAATLNAAANAVLVVVRECVRRAIGSVRKLGSILGETLTGP